MASWNSDNAGAWALSFNCFVSNSPSTIALKTDAVDTLVIYEPLDSNNP